MTCMCARVHLCRPVCVQVSVPVATDSVWAVIYPQRTEIERVLLTNASTHCREGALSYPHTQH